MVFLSSSHSFRSGILQVDAASMPPMARIMAIQCMEWRHVQRKVRTRIVPKLCKRKELTPVIQASMDEAAQINFQALIDALRLTIRLRVIRRAHAEFNPDDLEQLLPKSARKDWVPIRENDCFRETMQLVNVVQISSSYFSCSKGVVEG